MLHTLHTPPQKSSIRLVNMPWVTGDGSPVTVIVLMQHALLHDARGTGG